MTSITIGGLTFHADESKAFILREADDWLSGSDVKGSDMATPLRAGSIARRRRRAATIKSLAASVSGRVDRNDNPYADSQAGVHENLRELKLRTRPRQTGDGTVSLGLTYQDGVEVTGKGYVVNRGVRKTKSPSLYRAALDVEIPDGVLYAGEISWVIANESTAVDQYPSYFEGYGLVGPDGGLVLPGTADAFEARIEVTDGGGSDWFAVDNANFTDADGNPLSIGVDRGGGLPIEGTVVDCGKLTADLSGTNLIADLTRTVAHEEWLPLEPDTNDLALRGADEAVLYVRPVYG